MSLIEGEIMQDNSFDKVLITGAGGMVGSYADFGIKADMRMLDVTDLEETLRVVKKIQPTAIIHLAAETDLDRCERDPEHAYTVNAVGTYNTALAAKAVGAKIVYVSTSSIFDGEKKTPYTETDIPNPQSFYSRSKLLGEIALKETAPDFIIARACWMFGGGPSKDQKFVAKIIQQLGQPEIKVVDDKFGSPTFGKDLMAAIKQLIMQDKTGIFHLSNAGVCSRFEMAQQIAKVLDSKTKIIPVSSDSFGENSIGGKNESMSSKINLMRQWQDALADYLKTEWKGFL